MHTPSCMEQLKSQLGDSSVDNINNTIHTDFIIEVENGYRNLDRQNFSLISFSLIAALAHIFGQFIIVRIWIIPHNGVFYLLPIFLVSAFIFGLVNALVTNKLLKLNSKK